jgi:hypothetical protein
MATRKVIVIEQGSDSQDSLLFADAQDGDIGYGQIKRWAGGPVVANLAVSVNHLSNTITWSIDHTDSAVLRRSGYYDLKVLRGNQIITAYYGPAVLRAGITDVPVTPSESDAWGIGSWSSFDWPGDTSTSPWGAFPWGQDQWR